MKTDMNRNKANNQIPKLSQLAQPTTTDPNLLKGILIVSVFWSMIGLSILSFVQPDETMFTTLIRGLGWFLSVLMLPIVFAVEKRLSSQPVDLFKDLED